MDATYILPRIKVKDLLPLCSKNSIIFCIFRGALYHLTSYLQTEEQSVSERKETINISHISILTCYLPKCKQKLIRISNKKESVIKVDRS